MPHPITQIGGRFGKLTVIGLAGRGHREALWNCVCECGREVAVRGTRLRSGATKTCGRKGCKIHRHPDITGRVYGHLTVIRHAGFHSFKGQRITRWDCRCVCGKTINVPRYRLRGSDGMKSCGCRSSAATILRSTKHGMCGTPEYSLFHGARRRARLAGYVSNLELSDIVIPAKCPLLGIPLAQNKRAIGPGSPTVDRIDPKRGYMKGNIWVISQKANKMKSDMTLAEMKHFAAVIEAKMESLLTIENTTPQK